MRSKLVSLPKLTRFLPVPPKSMKEYLKHLNSSCILNLSPDRGVASSCCFRAKLNMALWLRR